ncbi:MAG TPA: phosphatidylglycerophosphatase A [Candidatus Binatia bacterium]|nr:phosphatidylglycerophosphatase A [Candidatus Binatia bacterium]
MRAAILFIASVAYLGYIPVASGTFGSLAAIPLFWFFDALTNASPVISVVVFVALVAGACWIADRADRYLQEHDSHKIVIDEVAGYVAATLFLPVTWKTALAAFFIFRVLDVIKPFPAGYIDANVAGGPGVVLDDVVSGIYSNLFVRALLWIGALT